MQPNTVTITIERFRELESAENAIHEVLKGANFLAQNDYERMWIIKDKDEVITHMVKALERAWSNLDAAQKKIHEYENQAFESRKEVRRRNILHW